MNNPEILFGDSANVQLVKDYTGELWYSNINKKWVISYHVPGTYDTVLNYYTMNLPDKYKEQGISVSFSGKTIEMTNEQMESLQIPLFGGHSYYLIYLTNIIRSN
jgi:hypothetical protein